MNRKGFTLVELLVMMVVLGILIGVSIPNITGIVANQKKNATKDDALRLVDNAKMKVAAKNDIPKPKTGECLIFTLDYLDSGSEFLTGPYGGEYSRYDSFVIYKKEGGKYNYYVRLVEKLDKGDYGINLANIEDLTSDGDAQIAKITDSTSLSETSSISDISNNSVVQKVCPSGSVKRYNDTEQATTVTTPTSFSTDSWDTIINTLKSGNTSAYPIGSTKSIDLGDLGTHTIRLSNTTPCTADYDSKTACGVVLEFADIVQKKSIISTTSTDSNRGGWRNCNLRNYLNADFYNKLPANLRNAIIEVKVVSGHGYGDNAEANFVTKDKVYILSSYEIYKGGFNYDTAISTRQLDYYKNLDTAIYNYSPAIKKYNGANSWYWMRSANSQDERYYNKVDSTGFFTTYINNAPWEDGGVSPAFRIA